MKKLIFFFICCTSATISRAQNETFDTVTCTLPKEWKKQNSVGTIQLSKEDAANGKCSMITLFKAIPGSGNSKENFELTCTSLLNEMITVSSVPVMQPVVTENDREVHSGYTPFEKDGNKGILVLVTSRDFKKW